MLTHRGFTAWIQVDGKVLQEYLVAVDDEAHRVSCWIPGKEGQVFTVYWQDDGGKVDTCSFITLDGLVVPGRFLFGDGVTCRGGVRTSISTERPFMFQKVSDEIVEESPIGKSSKDTGTIMLKIKRIRRVEYRPPNTIQPIPTVLGKRKAGDLCIGFGLEVRAPEQLPTTFKVASHEDPKATKPSTYVTFVFRYRSPEFLEAQGISCEENASPTAPGKNGKKRVVSARRVASLPPPRPPGAEESEESSESAGSSSEASPTKKPRLGPSTLILPSFPTGSRRPSAELRRAASWSNMGPPSDNQEPVSGGQSQFFLPRPRLGYNMPSSLPTLDSIGLKSAQVSTANSPESTDSETTEPSDERDSSKNSKSF